MMTKGFSLILSINQRLYCHVLPTLVGGHLLRLRLMAGRGEEEEKAGEQIKDIIDINHHLQ